MVISFFLVWPGRMVATYILPGKIEKACLLNKRPENLMQFFGRQFPLCIR
jgi:hypothetical protein